MKSIVLVGIKNDQISVRLNEDATQEQILEAIKKKMDVIKKLCKEGKNTINVVGKVLKDKEKDELRELINTEVKEEVVNELSKFKELHFKDIKVIKMSTYYSVFIQVKVDEKLTIKKYLLIERKIKAHLKSKNRLFRFIDIEPV